MNDVTRWIRRTLTATTGDGDDIAVLSTPGGALRWLGYPDAVQIDILHPAPAPQRSWWPRKSRNKVRDRHADILAELGFEPGPVSYRREISTTELDWDRIAEVITQVIDRVFDVRTTAAITIQTF